MAPTPNAPFPSLDLEAPPVPAGLRPKPGVEIGCGEKSCRICYEVLPPTDAPPADGKARS